MWTNDAKQKAASRKWKAAHKPQLAAYALIWREKNKDKLRANSRKYLYGITDKQHSKFIKDQNGKCAICRSSGGRKALSVDHDHETKKVRGLLCYKCNTGIALLGDDLNGVMRAVFYLA